MLKSGIDSRVERRQFETNHQWGVGGILFKEAKRTSFKESPFEIWFQGYQTENRCHFWGVPIIARTWARWRRGLSYSPHHQRCLELYFEMRENGALRRLSWVWGANGPTFEGMSTPSNRLLKIWFSCFSKCVGVIGQICRPLVNFGRPTFLQKGSLFRRDSFLSGGFSPY